MHTANPSLAGKIIQKAVATKDENLQLAVAHYFTYPPSGALDHSDIQVIERLLTHRAVAVKKAAIRCLSKFKDAWRRKAIDLAKRIDVGEDCELADALCSIFDDKHGIPFSALTDKDISAILKKLVDIPTLGNHGHNVEEFLASATKHAPIPVVQLLFKRLDRARGRRRAGREYTPIPYSGFQGGLKGISSYASYQSILDEALRRSYKAEGLDTFWLPILFKDISDGYCELSLNKLKEWGESGHPGKLKAVSLLLKEAPASFLFDHMEFAVDLLEKAHNVGEDCFRKVGSDLYSCALTEGRHGPAGQPMPQDVNLRERSTQALSKLQPGSPAYRFYESLQKLAEGNIKDDLARFEEEFSD